MAARVRKCKIKKQKTKLMECNYKNIWLDFREAWSKRVHFEYCQVCIIFLKNILKIKKFLDLYRV